jgi:hypothetical protein
MASLRPALGVRGSLDSRDAASGGIGGRYPKMSQQPESTSFSLAASPAPLPGSEAGRDTVSKAAPPQEDAPVPQRIPRWLERVELVLRVMVQIYIGLALCYAPWSHTIWDQNPLFLQFPTLAIFAANGAVRGLVSGLGLLNLWIAFEYVIRHRDG